MIKQKFLFSFEKENTGIWPVKSSSIIDLKQANQLLFIFQNYSGKVSDFCIYLDEFKTEKVPLSHLTYSSSPISPLEVNILKKFNLEDTGYFTPLDLLEEFEAMMGDILEDEENGEFILEGENEEDFLEEIEGSIII